ncbi:MAG: SUMF1/EgtB/PvdO family nonheme iron enzyme, partial [Candidatus Sericytochromatia bacterium]
TAYFAMEYLLGATLTQQLEKNGGRLAFAQAKAVLMPLLDALDEVHQKSVFHRDIKPDNIYITQANEPILLDFGAARQSLSGQTTHLLAFLTPGFAPLEQYSSNGTQGPWTDIYALAATIYFALTGVLPPVPTDRMTGVAELVLPSKLGSDIPPRDEEWLMQGLAVKWSHRPDSIQRWREMIEQPTAAVVLSPEALALQLEASFTRSAILPRLAHQVLTPSDEQAIYDAAAFMDIAIVQVRALIEEALASTGAQRLNKDPESEEHARLRQREAELRRKEEELREAEALRAWDAARWQEAEQTQREAEKATLEVERLRREERDQQHDRERLVHADELHHKEDELKRKETELKQALREAELKSKEAELLEMERRLKTVEAPAPDARPVQSLSEEDLEDLEDISDDEIEAALVYFTKPAKTQGMPKTQGTAKTQEQAPKADPHAEAAQATEPAAPKPMPMLSSSAILKLDAHYARLAKEADQIPASGQRLLSPERPLPERISNTLGMEFILISPLEERTGFALRQAFSVGPMELGFEIMPIEPFYLQTTPVTQRQWQFLMNNQPACFNDDPQLPLEQVSWDDCQIFIHRLNQLKEAKYRLPTEVEWAFACGEAKATPFFWGEDPAPLGDYAWYAANSSDRTHAVGLKRPNPLGLFDLLGNVREWVQDPYLPLTQSEYARQLAQGSKNLRVARGGSWHSSPSHCHTSVRNPEPATQRLANLGFRLAFGARSAPG